MELSSITNCGGKICIEDAQEKKNSNSICALGMFLIFIRIVLCAPSMFFNVPVGLISLSLELEKIYFICITFPDLLCAYRVYIHNTSIILF